MTQHKAPRWLVGIDLGTSHTAIAGSDLYLDDLASLEGWDIPQWVGPGAVGTRSLLPSVCYQATSTEIQKSDAVLPWEGPDFSSSDELTLVGEWARQLGAKTPGRLISSAKSWLSHTSADPTAPILPWGAPDEIAKISPIEASALYLRHVRNAWNHQHPDALLEDQDLTLTVPASFDEAARALTCEAARRAGLPHFQLLEEPQAVFYDWLWREKDHLQEGLNGVRLVLVVDLGGGTLDLTLISVKTKEGIPVFERIAVGQHLMLGGDNIDLALAHRVENVLTAQGGKVAPSEFSLLVEQCRNAKETLLSPGAPEACNVTLLGEGGRLIGGARSVRLLRQEVLSLVLDGFFPRVELGELPERRRSGVVEYGLPFARDPAVTRHLSAFLKEHRHAMAQALGVGMDEVLLPDALLLNGGIFKSACVVKHLMQQFVAWGGVSIRCLENKRPDASVAYGAVAAAWARRGRKIQKIRGGAARSLYLVLENEEGPPKACCLLPKGTEESKPVVLENRKFRLKVGTAVRFHLVATADDRIPSPGMVVALDEGDFSPLPPLNLVMDTRGSRDEAITVELVAALSPVGTLDLECVSVADPKQRWKIEFQLRATNEGRMPPRALGSDPRLDRARDLIFAIYGPPSKSADGKGVKKLRAELEQLLGPKETWTITLLRDLGRILIEVAGNRRRSLDHERVWLNLTGYCLRPGFGHPLDEVLVEKVFAIFAQSPQFILESQVWSEWWTLWRRIAGGLDAARQIKVLEAGLAYLEPSRIRRPQQSEMARKRAPEDLLRLVASLEHLAPKDKARLGGWILPRIEKPGDQRVLWWSLGRLGARSPWHGSAHNVIPPEDVLPWLEAMLKSDFRKNPEAALSAALIARYTGDRILDVSPELREKVIRQLTDARQPESWIRLVAEVSVLSESDEQRVLGDALPPGLELIN